MSIRKAKESDIERIVDLCLEFEDHLIALDNTLQQEPFPRERYERVLREGFDDPKHRIMVAEEGGRIVAFSDYWAYPEFLHGGTVGYLNNLYIVRDHRGSGLGRAMVEWILADARDRGLVAMHVGVKPMNVQAVGFYRHLGIDEELAMMEWRLDR